MPNLVIQLELQKILPSEKPLIVVTDDNSPIMTNPVVALSLHNFELLNEDIAGLLRIKTGEHNYIFRRAIYFYT